ncbi:MAG: HAD family phosphatase [Solirubrobacteraceae bacterium]
MPRIDAVISDFGGVLTSPLVRSFQAFVEDADITLADLGIAMGALAARRHANPLFELETGQLSEAEFLQMVGTALSEQVGREIAMDGFGERYFATLEPNERLIEYMRELRGRGYRLAICTNNVREWDRLWRSMLPVDEIFDVVVDSAFVGARKPDRLIYELTLERLGVAAGAALFIDDIEINCDAARELGMRAVWFRSTEQAIQEIEAALGQAA